MASKTIKVLMLLLLLGMPVLIYLFLQGFGENQYTLPVYYEDGLIDVREDCISKSEPHTLSSFIENTNCQNWNCTKIENKVVLLSFVNNECPSESMEAIARITNQYKDQNTFHSVSVSTNQATSDAERTKYLELYKISENSWSWWEYHTSVSTVVKCGLNLQVNCDLSDQAVLLDHELRIRGYYSTNEAEELDRIATEIAILLTDNP